MTQFVKCRFNPWNERSYTYANDGEPVAVGDMVKVPDAQDPEAWKRVEVVEIDCDEPTFACKPVLGLVTSEDTDAAILNAAPSINEGITP